MSTANTTLNCLFCFSNISTNFQRQNQKYLTASDIISCCSKHLSKEFIDSLNWTNVSSAAGILCQECYNIAEKLNNLNINLNKIFEEINKLGKLLNIRILEERKNYELATQKLNVFRHSGDTIQNSDLHLHTAYPDWNYDSEQPHHENHDKYQKEGFAIDSFNSVTDSFDDSNGSFFEDTNVPVDHGKKCESPKRKPINGNNKQGARKSFTKKKEIRDTVKTAVPKGDEIISSSELQRYLKNETDEGFKCDKCNKIFSTMKILLSHDCSKPTYECEVCNKSFSSTCTLKRHMRSHTGEKPYKCETCGKCFGIKCHLKYHIRIHTDERPFKCTFCEKAFHGSNGLRCHLTTTHEHAVVKKYKCDICSKLLSSLSLLKDHLLSHSEFPTEKCKICGKVFRHKKTLKKHEKMHLPDEERAHKCQVCGKGFNTTKAYEIHTRIHPGIQPFLCTDCGKSFYTASLLSEHSLLHTEKDPFTCEICDKVFNGSIQLKKHFKFYHSPEAIKCKKCAKPFNSKKLLSKHMESLNCTTTSIHQQLVKPVSCGTCGKTFQTVWDRKMHTKAKHLTQNDKHVCKMCTKTFEDPSSVRRHHNKHHPGVPFLSKKNENIFCEICKGIFVEKSYAEHLEKRNEESIIRCEHCPEIFYSVCECTVHRHKAHVKKKLSIDCKNTNMSLNTNVLANVQKVENDFYLTDTKIKNECST